MNKDEIYQKLDELKQRWVGRPPAPFMSKEYVDRRIDRSKWIWLKKQLNIIVQKEKPGKSIYEQAKEIFDL